MLGAWLPLFLIGVALHESMHASAVLLLGARPELVIKPWPLATVPLTVTGLHVQAVPPLDVGRQALDNLLGPGVAGIVFAAASWRFPGGAVRTAMLACAGGLFFYALIEPAYALLDPRFELDFLLTPELNYGVPILIALLAALLSTPAPKQRQRDSAH